MKLFIVVVFVITYAESFGAAKPTNDYPVEVQRFSKDYVSSLKCLYKSISTELDSCDNGIVDHLKIDVLAMLSIYLGFATSRVAASLGGIKEFLHGIFLSDGDIVQRIICGLYAGSTGAEQYSEKQFLDTAQSVVNNGGIKTPSANLRKSKLCKCPGDSRPQLEALISAAKRGIGATLHANGNTEGLLISLAYGATRGGTNIIKGLSKCPNNGNLVSKLSNSLDYGLIGFGKGLGEGLVKANEDSQRVPL